MSYTDDALRAKLSSLNEAQDTIVTVAQWILFHKRMATRTAELWLAKVKDTPANKRLSLIYLANEVVQQSKARKKDDFPNAFTPIIAEGTSIAYQGASLELQQKIRRVVEVWRQRFIFDEKTQIDVEAKLDEIDRTRATSKRGGLGGSLFSGGASAGGIPPRLQGVSALYTKLSASETQATTTQATFWTNEEAVRTNTTSLPIKAAQLNSLLNALGEVETSVAESMRARREVMAGLEALVAECRTALARDEQQVQQLTKKRAALKAEKEHVEAVILRGGTEADVEPARPEAEALTPPAVESLTPPPPDDAAVEEAGDGDAPAGAANGDGVDVAMSNGGAVQTHEQANITTADEQAAAPGSSEEEPGVETAAAHGHDEKEEEQQPLAKKRKLDQVDDFGGGLEQQPGDDAFGKLDPEVEALLAGN